jgi:hypothetical protein
LADDDGVVVRSLNITASPWKPLGHPQIQHSIICLRCVPSLRLLYDILSRADPMLYHVAQSWISHMTAKRLYFEAVSQYRMSQEDLAKQRRVRPFLLHDNTGILADCILRTWYVRQVWGGDC